jgi:hypothetical protein
MIRSTLLCLSAVALVTFAAACTSETEPPGNGPSSDPSGEPPPAASATTGDGKTPIEFETDSSRTCGRCFRACIACNGCDDWRFVDFCNKACCGN